MGLEVNEDEIITDDARRMLEEQEVEDGSDLKRGKIMLNQLGYEPKTINVSKPDLVVRQQIIADNDENFVDLKMIGEKEFIKIVTKKVKDRNHVFIQLLKTQDLGFKANSSLMEAKLPDNLKGYIDTLKKVAEAKFDAKWDKPVKKPESSENE